MAGDGDAIALGLGEGVSLGVGEGELVFLCFFDFGVSDDAGDGDALDLDEGAGGGLPFLFGVPDCSGVSVALGFEDAEEVGEGEVSSFFFFVVEILCRFFFGVGVGVGAKIFLSLAPNDSSAAGTAQTVVNENTPTSKSREIMFVRPREVPLTPPARAKSLCSNGFRRRDFPAENFR